MPFFLYATCRRSRILIQLLLSDSRDCRSLREATIDDHKASRATLAVTWRLAKSVHRRLGARSGRPIVPLVATILSARHLQVGDARKVAARIFFFSVLIVALSQS